MNGWNYKWGNLSFWSFDPDLAFSFICNPDIAPEAVACFWFMVPPLLLLFLAAFGEDEHAHCRRQYCAFHVHTDGSDSHSPGDQTSIRWEDKTTKSRIPLSCTDSSDVSLNSVDGCRADLTWFDCGHISRGPCAAIVWRWPEEGNKPSLAQPVSEDCRPAGCTT